MAITKIVEEPSGLPYAHLYLEDIERICQVLIEAMKDFRAEDKEELTAYFVVRGFKLDSIEDLKEYGGSTTDFRISIGGSYLRCELTLNSYWGATESFPLKGEKRIATHAKVKAIFDQRAFLIRNVVAQLPLWLVWPIPLAALYAAVPFIAWIPARYRVGGGLAYVGALAVIVYLSVRPSRVSFVRSHEHSKRRGQKTGEYIEKIFLLAAGALIGAVIARLIPR